MEDIPKTQEGPLTKLKQKNYQSQGIYIKYIASHSFPLNIKHIHAYAWAILCRCGQPEQSCKTRPSEKW